MIDVQGLTKTYGGNRGISDITFTVNEGEIVGFLGPNGAGKSTTMNIITGYLSAAAGSARIAGVDILENPMEAKKHIGYLPEQPPLYLGMTVREYLEFVCELKGVKKQGRKEHILEIVDLTGLAEVYKRVIGHLSKGYRQRVGLAQALISDPDVLILDEPTVGLDPRQIVEIRNVIKDMGKKRTIILSTHILPEVSAICERVLVISNGVIVADGKPENLAAAMSGERELIVRAAGPKDSVRQLLKALDGIKDARHIGEIEAGSHDFLIESQPNADIRKPMFNALAKAGYPILMLRPQDATLEQVFLRLTGDENIVGDGLPDVPSNDNDYFEDEEDDE